MLVQGKSESEIGRGGGSIVGGTFVRSMKYRHIGGRHPRQILVRRYISCASKYFVASQAPSRSRYNYVHSSSVCVDGKTVKVLQPTTGMHLPTIGKALFAEAYVVTCARAMLGTDGGYWHLPLLGAVGNAPQRQYGARVDVDAYVVFVVLLLSSH